MKEELQGLLLQAKQMESEQYEILNTVGHPDGLCMSSCGLNRRNLIKSRKDEYTRNFI